LLRRQAAGDQVEARAPLVPQFRPTPPPELPVDDLVGSVTDDGTSVDDAASTAREQLTGPHASWAALISDGADAESATHGASAASGPSPVPGDDGAVDVGDDEWAAAVIDFPTEMSRRSAKQSAPAATAPVEDELEQPETAVTVGVLTAEAVDQMALPDVDESGLERDVDGTIWERNSPAAIVEGQTISIGDLDEVRVIEALGVFEDEFDGSEVWRFVVDNDGEEEVIDLNEEDVVLCRQHGKAA